jgi:hypothetical protein
MNPNFGQQPMQPMQTGFAQQNPGFNQFQQNGIINQPSGVNQFAPPQQPMQTGFAPFQQSQQTGFQPQLPQQSFVNQNASPFADPPRQAFQPLANQPTGIPQSFSPPGPLNPQATGINSLLPPALQPQRTGFQPSPIGFGQSATPPVPPIPQQPTLAPLQPQKTGPAPPVRFGVSPAAQKLMPQATGRRANLSQASMCYFPSSPSCIYLHFPFLASFFSPIPESSLTFPQRRKSPSVSRANLLSDPPVTTCCQVYHVYKRRFGFFLLRSEKAGMAKGFLFFLFFARLSFRHLICARLAEEGWVRF